MDKMNIKKYIILVLILPFLLSACSENKLETVNQTIEENQIGESDLTNDITKKPAQVAEPKKETLQETNNVDIDGDIDLSKKNMNSFLHKVFNLFQSFHLI